MSSPPAPPEDLGLWRFGIISPLLHRGEGAPPLRKQLEELAGRVFYTPDGIPRQFRPDTLRDYLSRYRAMGLEGLRPKPRKDRGSTSVPAALGEALEQLRAHNPDVTFKRLLEQLREQQLWNGRRPSRSALYRYCSAHALKRGAVAPPSPVRSFAFPFFGELWSADFLHGPDVRQGSYTHKTWLHAIIDDATRYVVGARFHLAEDTRALLDDLMLALRRFGIPKRFYTDNGAAFRSRHLRLVAARLGIALPHTPPYTPRGRGKIERFLRTVREGLLTGRGRTTLERLNADLSAWLSRYHNTLHSTLGMTPLERKLSDTGPALRQLAPTQDIDALFRMELPKRVGRDGCVRLFKRRFEIPDAISGSIVTVSYLPWNQDYIVAGEDKRIITPLDAQRNARRFDKPHRRGTLGGDGISNTNTKE